MSVMSDELLKLFSSPGHDDAQTGGADPGRDHESSVQKYQQLRLGGNRSWLAQSSRGPWDNLRGKTNQTQRKSDCPPIKEPDWVVFFKSSKD